MLLKGVKNWARSIWLSERSSTRREENDTPAELENGLQDWQDKRLYLSLSDLPFTVFQKAFCERDYSILAKPGTSEEDIERIWVRTLSSFYVATDDSGIKAMISQLGEVTAADSYIYRTKLYCSMVLESDSQQAMDILRGMGFDYPYTEESKVEDIQKVIKRLANKQRDRDMIQKSLDDFMNKNNDEHIGPDRRYTDFATTISLMERVFKVPIIVSDMSTMMYAVKVKALKEELDRVKHKEMFHG